MSSLDIFYCTLGMCFVTYLPRVLPPLLLANRNISPLLKRWLQYVPTSVFGALVFSEIFIKESGLDMSLLNINLLASLVVLAVAVKTRSLAKSIVCGLLSFWLLQNIIC
jgi:Predicted membrane protein